MISVVIPCHNEEENIIPLLEEIKKLSFFSEIETIVIDDGSTDDTYRKLIKYKENNSNLRIIKFKKNFGQTPSLSAGFKHAQGDIVIQMDGDGQNNPSDIPKLLDKLNEGYDCVCGWRKDRKDTLSKKIPSKISNLFARKLLKSPVHDSGCSLKAYKKDCIKNLRIFGEMHRFIPSILKQQGFKVGEIETNHRPRLKGKTKYNSRRLLKGLLDSLFVAFWGSFSTRPLHFFGFIAFIQYILSFIIVIEQIIKAVFFTKALNIGPLLLLAVMLFLNASLFVMFGFLGEIIIRAYYKDRDDYIIESIF